MALNRTPFLLACSAAALFAACGKEKPAPPNVVIILGDDVGYGDLGCYGAVGVQTPNVDRFASEGLRFTNAHAAASTSTPSRYALLTGEYPWRKDNTDIAAGNAGMIIRPEQYTMADMFKSLGYRTCAFGKWHLGLGDVTGSQDWNRTLEMDLHDIGFDHYYIMAATADRVPCVFIENGNVVNHDPDAPIEVSYEKNFEGEPTLKTHPELAYNLKSSQGHDMSVVNGIGRIGYMRGGGRALWKDENIADSITVNAVRYIDAHAKEPFFMYFATNDIHVPRWPAERFRGASSMGLRGDAIAQFDWSVGQILDALERNGLENNTIVILTSDNGPVLDDGYVDMAEELVGLHSPTGHLRGGKYSSFEGGTVIPLIIRGPGIEGAGSESGRLVSQIDFFRSLGNYFGASIPDGAAPDSRDWSECSYVIEQAYDHTLSVATDEWKYIRPSAGTPLVPWGTGIETGHVNHVQLFDLRSGRQERMDVSTDHPEVVRRLEEILTSEENRIQP